MGAFPFWAHRREIRTRKGAELRKCEAFSSAARKERGAAAEKADAESLRPISAESPWHSANRTDAAKRRDSNRHLGTFLKCRH